MLSHESLKLLEMRFGVQKIGKRSFMARLYDSGVDQVDVVLVLLSENYLFDVEKIIGKPITHCPPDPALSPTPYPKLPERTPEPYVEVLVPNPPVIRQRAERWAVVKDGMTLKKLYRLGVKKRDIDSWTRRKYIRVVR